MRVPWSGYRKIIGTKRRYKNTMDLLFKQFKIHWWLLGIVFVLAAAWLAFPIEERQKLITLKDFKLGEESRQDIFTPVDFKYHDVMDTDEEKQEALSEIPPVFKIDLQELKKAEEEFNIVNQVRADETLDNVAKVAKMQHLFYIGPSTEVGFILVKVPEKQIEEIKNGVIKILSDILSKGVVADAEQSSFVNELLKIDYIKPKWARVKKELEKQIGQETTDYQIAAKMQISLSNSKSGEPMLVGNLITWSDAIVVARKKAKELPEPINFVVEEMCVDLMRPNLIYDPGLTKKRQDIFINNVLSIDQNFSSGDKIISSGEIVTESHIKKLKAMSSAQSRLIINNILGVLLLTLIVTYILITYMKRHEPLVLSEPRKLLALSITIILSLGLGNLIITNQQKLGLEYAGFLVPTALASIVVAILTNVQLSMIVTCIIGILIAMQAGINQVISLEYFLVILSSGVVAAMSASNARHRRHLFIPGAYVCVTNVATIFGLGLLVDMPVTRLGTNCIMGMVNGIMVALLTPGLLPIFEYLSRTTTDMELMELSDLNQPLLTQLKEKASGSYYHSIDVAKLAETAAEAIKANSLLARVGSYYHDIGKMTKSEYFIENQKGENLHDKLNPSMSSRVISSHVKDGVKIAKDYKLPQVIQDIIQQHHGNTLIGGLRFYQKAVEIDRHNTVRIEDYRYQGPRPQTKEAAIILLADSVESARHVVLRDNPAYSRLISFVREIVEDKTMDSQLDECDLSLRDVNLITDAFVKVLSGMYHTRIEYPKDLEAVDARSTDTRGLEQC